MKNIGPLELIFIKREIIKKRGKRIIKKIIEKIRSNNRLSDKFILKNIRIENIIKAILFF
jgi:hypothetical protein